MTIRSISGSDFVSQNSTEITINRTAAMTYGSLIFVRIMFKITKNTGMVSGAPICYIQGKHLSVMYATVATPTSVNTTNSHIRLFIQSVSINSNFNGLGTWGYNTPISDALNTNMYCGPIVGFWKPGNP